MSIARFAQSDGRVSVHLLEHQKVVRLLPQDALFCAKRVWNQTIEHGLMRRVEDDFHALAERILNCTTFMSLSSAENKVVSRFYALCRLRMEAKENPPAGIQMKHAQSSVAHSKSQEEILETNGCMFAQGTTMPSRHLASIRIQVLLDRLCPSDTVWAPIYSRKTEFLAPDSFRDIGIVPLSPHRCLVANSTSGEVSSENAIEINRLAIGKSLKYYFAHDLASCGI